MDLGAPPATHPSTTPPPLCVSAGQGRHDPDMRAIPVCAPCHESLREAAVPPVPGVTAPLPWGPLGTTLPESRPCLGSWPAPCPWPPASFSAVLPPSSSSLGLAPAPQHSSSYCTYWGEGQGRGGMCQARPGAPGHDPHHADLGPQFLTTVPLLLHAEHFHAAPSCLATRCSVCSSISAICTGHCVSSAQERGN